MTDRIARQSHRLISCILAPIEAAGTRFLATAGMGTIAIASLIAAIAFLSVAIDAWVATFLGTAIAAVCTGGFYLAVAIVCLLVMRLRSRVRQGAKRSAKASAQAAGAASIEESLAPFIAILHESELKREEVALRLGTEIAKQLGPMALVATALIAGFILQRSLQDPKKKSQ